MAYVGERLDADTKQAFESVLEEARRDPNAQPHDPSTVREVRDVTPLASAAPWLLGVLVLAALGLVVAGVRRGGRS